MLAERKNHMIGLNRRHWRDKFSFVLGIGSVQILYRAALYPVGTERLVPSRYRAAYYFAHQKTIPIFSYTAQNKPFSL